MMMVVDNPGAPRSEGRSWHVWLIVWGLAVALALPLIASATKPVSVEVKLRRALAALAPAERSVTLSIVDSTGREHYEQLSSGVEAVLRNLGGSIPIREVIFRETTDTNGGGFVLAGADDLASLVQVTEGRLPTSCQPERCELIQVGVSASTTFNARLVQSSFGLVVVGGARRSNDLLLSGTFQPADDTPLLVGGGTDSVAAVAALSTHGRTVGWVQPVDASRVIDLGLTSWLGRAERAPDDLHDLSPYFVGTVPSDTVTAVTHRAQASAGASRYVGIALPIALAGLVLVVGVWPQRRRPQIRPMFRLGHVAAAVLLTATLEPVICSLIAARSPIGFGRVERAALDGAPAAAVIFFVVCLTAATFTWTRAELRLSAPSSDDDTA